MQDLLLRDFRPSTTTVTEAHLVERPRYPAIDAHVHLGCLTDAFGDVIPEAAVGDMRDPAVLVEIMDRCGITAIGNLTGRWGDELRRLIEQYEGRYAGRFYVFANVDWSAVAEPGFGERAAAQLEDSVRAGARGLKIFKNLGLTLRDASGNLIPPDDDRFDPLWAKAGELGVPVLIHVADPAAFFQPLGPSNEDYMELSAHPDWHFYGPGIPSFQELIEGGIRLMERHPKTTFITAHTGWYSENLKFVGERMMDKLPNMYTDFSARLSRIGRTPYSARNFFIKYQDRIVFGTDMTPGAEMYQTWFRYLETADEYFEASPGDALHRIDGLYLPDVVLEKVYHQNIEKLVPGLA